MSSVLPTRSNTCPGTFFQLWIALPTAVFWDWRPLLGQKGTLTHRAQFLSSPISHLRCVNSQNTPGYAFLHPSMSEREELTLGSNTQPVFPLMFTDTAPHTFKSELSL